MIVHDNKQEPHWAPGSADYLASILTGEEAALEWGGGGSTPWLISQVQYLHTVESDPDWAERILAWVGDEEDFVLHVHPLDSEKYVKPVERFIGVPPLRALWLIDGYRRIDCLDLVEKTVRPGDIVVMDDALDYAEHLLPDDKIKRFMQPHPYAGTPITDPKHKAHRNTVRTHHAMTKETWIWQV